MFVNTGDVVSSSDPYYRALGRWLDESGFDQYVEEVCAAHNHASQGRPGLPPAVHFRMLMIGFLEGMGSERKIAWSCNDSIALLRFLGYGITQATPDHSTVSKTRRRV